MITTNQLSLIAGNLVLAVAEGDRLETARQAEQATRTVDALDLIEAVASISIESMKAMCGDQWLHVMHRAMRDVAAQVDRERNELN